MSKQLGSAILIAAALLGSGFGLVSAASGPAGSPATDTTVLISRDKGVQATFAGYSADGCTRDDVYVSANFDV